MDYIDFLSQYKNKSCTNLLKAAYNDSVILSFIILIKLQRYLGRVVSSFFVPTFYTVKVVKVLIFSSKSSLSDYLTQPVVIDL